MQFRATEIARAVDGALVGSDVEVDGATIDSRAVTPRQLFVPVVAERDGHDFVSAAVAEGASAYLTSRAPQDVAASAIEVADTGAALRKLGGAARDRLTDRVIGITGSVGKTSVKDLTAAALRGGLTVHANPRSFNNELGVPLTLVNAPEGVDAVVIEMGARGLRHIADLCEIARPSVGVVTIVALAHAEMFGTIDDVAVAKGELVEALPASGTAVLNGDDPLVAAMSSRTSAHVLTFGLGGRGADVTASGVVIDAHLRPSFRLESPWGHALVDLPVHGSHQVMNALAAASAALVSGVDIEAVASGLSQAELSPWRMELKRAPSGALVLNDAYNANPTSMAAALRALASLQVDRHVAVLGVMAELGPAGTAEHLRIGVLARELGVEVIAVGTDAYGDAVPEVSDVDAVADALGPLTEHDAVLVKGSRVAGLERVAERLLA